MPDSTGLQVLKCRVSGRRHSSSSFFLPQEEDAKMDARPKTRQVDRERKTPPPQPPRGAKQIVIPMTRPQYDDLWHDPPTRAGVPRGWARVGSGVVPGGLRPRLSPARLRARVAQAPRPEAAEDRPGRRHLLLAPPQLRHRLHDRDRRGVGVSRCSWRRMAFPPGC